MSSPEVPMRMLRSSSFMLFHRRYRAHTASQRCRSFAHQALEIGFQSSSYTSVSSAMRSAVRFNLPAGRIGHSAPAAGYTEYPAASTSTTFRNCSNTSLLSRMR